MQERILCAAIWYKDLSYKYDIPTDSCLPRNCDRGLVFCGHRHPQCMYTMVAITGLRSVTTQAGDYTQGFLTNLNRFVDRTEALQIAITAKQIISKQVSKELYSEDIY